MYLVVCCCWSLSFHSFCLHSFLVIGCIKLFFTIIPGVVSPLGAFSPLGVFPLPCCSSVLGGFSPLFTRVISLPLSLFSLFFVPFILTDLLDLSSYFLLTVLFSWSTVIIIFLPLELSLLSRLLLLLLPLCSSRLLLRCSFCFILCS